MSAHKLGYLLKHAYQRYGELTTSELAPLGIRPGEWAALSCLDEPSNCNELVVPGKYECLPADLASLVIMLFLHLKMDESRQKIEEAVPP